MRTRPTEFTEHIYRQYEDELSHLKDRLLVMGGLAEERLRAAVAAIVARDTGLAEQVVHGDEPLNQLHKEIDDRSFKLLALRQLVLHSEQRITPETWQQIPLSLPLPQAELPLLQVGRSRGTSRSGRVMISIMG